MAGHEWPDWFEREELIGQISDIRVQNLQVEREVVQKRTFTRWMNLHLEKCKPPLQVHDLFRDLQDGRILMTLLEELSGCSLLHGFKASSHRIFRLNNIAKVLAFLEERNVKLVSIDAADVADGNSSIVLGLIWNIILFFQIKELTGNIRNQFPSSSSLSSIPTSSDSDTSHSSTPSDERRPSFAARDHGKAIKTLLQWVQRRTRKYGVAVQDFGKSWMSGLAFLAVIKSIDPSLVDMRRALLRSSRENIEEAFRTAHYSLGIPRLLEPEDVTLDPPDEQSIMTYVSQFLEHFPGIEEDEHSDFLERSKVSARMNEPPVRNGVRRKREKSYVVKRDWVQPPPKIFVSSVTEEQEHTPSPTEDRPWASEESSVGSSPSSIDSHPPCHQPEKSPNKDTSSASASGSPHPSLIDSAMDSTDSWAEMPSELQQSCSDFSLSEGATPEMLKYSTSVGELTPDSELPPLLESVSHDPTDPELFIDEGNFSIGSVESLQAKSTLLSEEEDAYRYILDLKEERSDNYTLSEDIVDSLETQQTQTCQDQSPETVKPAPYEPLCEDSDSGYYPGHKDVSATMLPDDVSESLSFAKSDSQVSDVRNAVNIEHSKEILEPSTLQDLQKVLTEPDQGRFLEDDAECPVLRYERISISESEDDIEEAFCAESCEEMLPNEATVSHSLSDVFESDTLKEDSEKDEERLANFMQAVEIDQVSNSDQFQEQPAVLEAQENNLKPGDIADQACSDPQILSHSRQPGTEESEADNRQDNSQDFESAELLGLSDAPVMEDLTKAISQASSRTVLETDFPDFTKTGEEMSCKFNYSEGLEVGECNEQKRQEDAVAPQEAKTEDKLNKVSLFTEDTQSATEHSGDGEKLTAELFLSDGQKSEADVVKEKEEVEVFNKVAIPPEDAPGAAERPVDNMKVDSKLFSEGQESHMSIVKDKEEVKPHELQYTSDSKLSKVRNLSENAPNATEDSGSDEMFSEGQQNENSIVKEVVEPCEPRYISSSVLNKVTVPPEDSPSAAEPPGDDMKVTAELFSSESQQSETGIVKDKDKAKSTNQPQLSTTDSDPMNSCGGVVLVSASAASKEPDRGTVFAEEEERPFTPPTPYSPFVSEPGLDENWDRGMANHTRDEGHATWEERQRIVGSAERSERFPAELRLSLSVTPLLPAPSQAGNADSDGERSAQEKVREGSVESPGQSPFELWSRHPGEWGALETDLPSDLSELTNSDEELTSATNTTSNTAAAAITGARENTEELREEVKNDGESRRSTDLYMQETTGPEELQEKENCDTTDALTLETKNERNESRTAQTPVKSCEMDVTEIYLLLVMWLLLYCLLVLPQMDVWTLPSLLLNLNPS